MSNPLLLAAECDLLLYSVTSAMSEIVGNSLDS